LKVAGYVKYNGIKYGETKTWQQETTKGTRGFPTSSGKNYNIIKMKKTDKSINTFCSTYKREALAPSWKHIISS